MRYDPESNKIEIGLAEFVSIARRRISATATPDEDEPCISEPAARSLKSYLPEAEKQTLRFGFDSEGYSFELVATVADVRDDRLTVAGEYLSRGKKPRREELAQLRGEGFISAHILSALQGYERINIRTVGFSQVGEIHDECETVEKKKLTSFFNRCVKVLSDYARPEVERVTVRLPSLKGMKFPYASIREGQSEFVRSAYRTLSRGGVLYASAPTGTGKTVSALYPALRALGERRFDKIFYLTPKTTTAEAVRDCLSVMESGGAICRAVQLAAKEKCCINGHLCRTSRRLCKNSPCKCISEATLALYDLGKTMIDERQIKEMAAQFSVCPHELALSYSELCDLVVCDFNYLFDPSVYIKRYFSARGSYAFLIDEAHNLPERVREMYSAELSASDVSAPADCELISPLSELKKLSEHLSEKFSALLYPYVREDIRERPHGEKAGAVKLSEIPSRLYDLIGKLAGTVEEELRRTFGAEDEERDARIAYLRAYDAKLSKFSAMMDRFDSSYKLFVFYEHEQIRARIYCLDTAPVIRERLELGHSAALFSATLSPLGYYRAVLGGERYDDTLEVGSPFAPEQLSVSIMDKISTRFSERDDTLGAVSRVIAATVSAKRGNYMIFSPSFAYSEALARSFSAKYPKIRVISQTADMTRREKEDFLAEFKKEDKSYLVAFCVMGGIYSEGIDLAGDSLIGAVIVGIGMPALSYERETIAEYFEEKYEEGKQYAYIYPGMNRVFQAAGRVIRREDDRGVIVLIDDRFADPIYKKSLPKLWEGVKFIEDPKRLREVLDEFWRDVAAEGE